MSFALRQVLDIVTHHDHGWKQSPKGGDIVLGMMDTICTNTSFPTEPAQVGIGGRMAVPPRLPGIVAPTPRFPSSLC